MPNVMAAQPNIGGALCESSVIPFLVPRRKVWLASPVHTFSGALAPEGILSGAKFTLRPSLVFFYIGSVIARHWSSGRQPNFAAWYKEWTELSLLVIFNRGRHLYSQGGHHVGHPTF